MTERSNKKALLGAHPIQTNFFLAGPGEPRLLTPEA